jgi:hypothetical protein
VRLIKLWFSVSQAEQLARFQRRQADPVRQWKLSPMDLASVEKWDDYTQAKEAMFFYTDTADAPWTVIRSNDKKRARPRVVPDPAQRSSTPPADLPTRGDDGRRLPREGGVGVVEAVTGLPQYLDDHVVGRDPAVFERQTVDQPLDRHAREPWMLLTQLTNHRRHAWITAVGDGARQRLRNCPMRHLPPPAPP